MPDKHGMSAGASRNVPPPGLDAIERSRKYRTPVKPTAHPYVEVVPAMRPGPMMRGVPFELKVNWFSISFRSMPIYIYEATVELGRRTKTGFVYEKVQNRVTIATIVYKAIYSNRTLFNNPWKYFFDDYEYIFTPDLIEMGNSNSLRINAETGSGRNKKYYRLRVEKFVKFDLALRAPGCADSNGAKWSSIFIKLLLTQNARFIPPELGPDYNQSIHARFIHLKGGMFFIPTVIDHNSDTAIKKRIQPGVDAWMGFDLSCRQLEDGKPVVQVGKTNAFFVSQNLNILDFYLAIVCSRDQRVVKLSRTHVMSAEGIADFTERLSGIKVRCDWTPDIRNGIVVGKLARDNFQFVKVLKTYDSSDNCYINAFDRASNMTVRVSVEEWYARQEPRQILQYPKLPLCEVKSGKTTHKLPMEMLFTCFKPQKSNKEIDANVQVAEKLMTRPNEHHRYTTDMVARKMEYDSDPYLRAMDFHIERNMVELTGRVLNKSGIIQADDSGTKIAMNPETGQFPLRKAYETTEKEVIFVNCRSTERLKDDDVKNFCKGLVEKCKSRGLKVSHIEKFETAYCNEISPFIEKMLTFLERRKREDSEILVLLFFVGNMDDELYGEIKLLSDIDHGVVTQVIKESTVIKMKPSIDRTVKTDGRTDEMGDYSSIYHNLWLKINVKLGGINQIVDFSGSSDPACDRMPTHDRTMFIGIDVTHPSDKARIHSCSLAAMVASIDVNAAKYADRIMVNTNCNETVQHFEEHFAPLLLEYRTERGHYPERVVILRDGVSKSEMIMAASRELQSIKQTWFVVTDEAPFPLFTYIVVQKRHGARFYRRDVQVHNANPFPATVIAERAVSPHKFDFYMISHYTPAGTSRPAHYTVVLDQSNSSTDEITEMCFRLCCLYARCSKPVSIPAPVLYAHLRCERAAIQFRRAVNIGDLAEIEDIKRGEDDQQYMERVVTHARDIEKALNRDFTQPKKYPGMHFV